MTREQAINYLRSSGMSGEQIKAVEDAFTADDCISKQALIDDLYEKISDVDIYERVTDIVEAQPIVGGYVTDNNVGRSDCISRQAAIDACDQSINILEATDRIRALPPVEQKVKPMEHFNSVQEHIALLAGDYKCWDNRLSQEEALELHKMLAEKQGKWKKEWYGDTFGCYEYVCSKCGCGEDMDFDYCPNCGCRMVEPKEGGDKE